MHHESDCFELLAAIIVSKIYNIYKFSIGRKEPDWGGAGERSIRHTVVNCFVSSYFSRNCCTGKETEYNKKRKGEKKK